MEFKTCTQCKKSKPVGLFYLLTKKKTWRRSRCIDCHKKKDNLNRKIRRGIVMIAVMLLSTGASGQGNILDSINYYRADPSRTIDNYGVTLRENLYVPTHSLVADDYLMKFAQKLANKSARRDMYFHKGNFNSMSICVKTDVEDDAIRDIMTSKKHDRVSTKNMLILSKDDQIGIGLARSEKTGWTYIHVITYR